MDSTTKQKIFQGIVVPKSRIEADVTVVTNINEGLYEGDEVKDKMQEESVVYTLSEDYPELLQELER